MRRPCYWPSQFDTSQYLPVATLIVVDRVFTKATKKLVNRTLEGLNKTSFERLVIEALPSQRRAARAAVMGTESMTARGIVFAAIKSVMPEVCNSLIVQDPPVPAHDGWKSFCDRVGVWLDQKGQDVLEDFNARVIESIVHEQTRIFESLLEKKW